MVMEHINVTYNQTRSKGNFLGLTLFCKMKPDDIIIKKLKE